MAEQVLRIEGYMCKKEPDRRPLVQYWTEKCIRFYEDPENERAYQEWKKERDEKRRG